LTRNIHSTRNRDRLVVRRVGGAITLVVVKTSKVLKVVGKGAALGHVLGADPQPVDVALTAGTQRSCMRFGGTATFAPGCRFKATSAAAPASCP
jgi:hypothetical protein